MITAAVLGVLSSTITEIINAINKKLAGTPFRGDGAFLVAFVMSIAASLVKVFGIDHTPIPLTPADALPAWNAIAPTLAEIWTVSQVYFLFVVEKLHLDVAPPAPTPAPAPVAAPAPATPAPAPVG